MVRCPERFLFFRRKIRKRNIEHWQKIARDLKFYRVYYESLDETVDYHGAKQWVKGRKKKKTRNGAHC